MKEINGEYKTLSGARTTNEISIEFEIQPKFVVLWFEIYASDHKEIVHTSRQCNCRDVCKISCDRLSMF